jgi:hypothetical protein
MSSLAFPREPAARTTTLGALSDLLARRGSDVLLAVAIMALAAALLAYLPSAFSVDSWLALVTGRDVWQSGLPHHEALTSLSHGATWIDQQWLSQLGTYGLYLVGGLALVGFVNVALIAAGVAGAVVGARKLGAHPRAVMLVLPVCLWLLIPSREIRTQEFVIPLFVATVYLLASDSRTPSRRVYWCLPILVLWANLHGTVTLGAMLVALRGATLAWERRASLLRSLDAWRRPLALVLGAVVCMLVTPYGLGILSYLHTMFLGSTVRDAVTEWQPVTSAFIVAWPFFLVAGAAVWAFGRYPNRTTLFERLALIALAAGSVLVIRNLLFFSLCTLMLLPVALDVGTRATEQTADRVRARINTALVATALAALVIVTAGTLVRPTSTIELAYQRTPILNIVQGATRADPSLKVLADVRFADWLLWRAPSVRGRIANDARFELLTPPQTLALQKVFAAVGPNWKRGAAGYRLIVLDEKASPEAAHGLLQESGRRVLYNDGQRLVILRSAAQAAA